MRHKWPSAECQIHREEYVVSKDQDTSEGAVGITIKARVRVAICQHYFSGLLKMTQAYFSVALQGKETVRVH